MNLRLPLVALTVISSAFAQPDPRDAQIRSVNFDTGVLELFNFGSSDLDLTGWRFCSHDSNEVRRYSATSGLNGVVLEAGTSVFVHFNNDAPAGDPDRLDRSAVGSFAVPLDQDAYGIQLYRPGANGSVSFGNSSLITDHLQWNQPSGSAGSSLFRSGQAVSEGLWTGASEVISTTSDTFLIRLEDSTGGRLHGPLDYAALEGTFRIEEVLVDPVGPDAGNQIIEIRNVTGAPYAPVDQWICVPFDYAQFPTIEVDEGEVVRLHIAASGTNTATDWFLPTLSPLSAAETVMLFRGFDFGASDRIVDAMSFGGGMARINQAIQIGEWSDANDSVSLPAVEGWSISFGGEGVGSEFWYVDASPTLGQTNGQDVRVEFGLGCGGANGIPTLRTPTPGGNGNRSYQVVVEAGQAGVLGALNIGNQIAPIDFLGCQILVAPLASVSFLTGGANGEFGVPLPLPATAALSGAVLSFQGLVQDATAPNGLFSATSGLEVTFF
ncbi:MAG: hypothetical protein AAF196_06410 [Planctomycetota bacterium]